MDKLGLFQLRLAHNELGVCALNNTIVSVGEDINYLMDKLGLFQLRLAHNELGVCSFL